jgi:hypothetical protein
VKERIDKIDSKGERKGEKKYSSYVQLKQTEEKQSRQKPPIESMALPRSSPLFLVSSSVSTLSWWPPG